VAANRPIGSGALQGVQRRFAAFREADHERWSGLSGDGGSRRCTHGAGWRCGSGGSWRGCLASRRRFMGRLVELGSEGHIPSVGHGWLTYSRVVRRIRCRAGLATLEGLSPMVARPVDNAQPFSKIRLVSGQRNFRETEADDVK
jgi:hypothetical protein